MDAPLTDDELSAASLSQTPIVGRLIAELRSSRERIEELEDHLAAALDVIIAVENKEYVFVVDGSVASKSLADVLTALQVRLDEETKPYSERRLVVRRRPEHGWAVWDKDTGEKLRPVNPNQWFRDRKTALAAKATEQPPMGVK
jgi:predicted NBD/HSP70 family sugar kinase